MITIPDDARKYNYYIEIKNDYAITLFNNPVHRAVTIKYEEQSSSGIIRSAREFYDGVE